jgi:hypothetical protein
MAKDAVGSPAVWSCTAGSGARSGRAHRGLHGRPSPEGGGAHTRFRAIAQRRTPRSGLLVREEAQPGSKPDQRRCGPRRGTRRLPHPLRPRSPALRRPAARPSGGSAPLRRPARSGCDRVSDVALALRSPARRPAGPDQHRASDAAPAAAGPRTRSDGRAQIGRRDATARLEKANEIMGGGDQSIGRLFGDRRRTVRGGEGRGRDTAGRRPTWSWTAPKM